MEILPFIPSLGKVLLDLKGKYDQHHDNKNEIKELQLFIEDYNKHIPDLQKRFRQGLGGNAMGTVVLNILERDIVKATKKLQQWSTNDSFFRVFNSEQRMKKLEHLHSKVMASVQKNLGIASLSTLMDVRESQTTILNSISDSNAQLKLFLSECIGNMHGSVVRVVKEEVMQAGKMSFADQKFWEEVLAAVNQRETETHYFYMDPILSELMIDPVVASNGHTYCRWTIIDNNMKKNPYDPSEDLTILVDNLTVRPRLFEEFPKQLEEFCERREKFRSKALALFSKDLLGDAAVALKYVLQWNKNDQECVTAFLHVQEELKKIKGALLSRSSSTCDSSSEDEFDSSKIFFNPNVEHTGKDYQQKNHPEQPCKNVVNTSSKSKIECDSKPPHLPPRAALLLEHYCHSQQSFSPFSSSRMEDDAWPHSDRGEGNVISASPLLLPTAFDVDYPVLEGQALSTGEQENKHEPLQLQPPQPPWESESKQEALQIQPQPPWEQDSKHEALQLQPQLPWETESKHEALQLQPQPPWERDSKHEALQLQPQLPWEPESKHEALQVQPQMPWEPESKPEALQVQPQMPWEPESKHEALQVQPQMPREPESKPEALQLQPQPPWEPESKHEALELQPRPPRESDYQSVRHPRHSGQPCKIEDGLEDSNSNENYIGRRPSSQDYKGKRSSTQDYKGERSSSQDYQGKRSSTQNYKGERSSSQDYQGKRSSTQNYKGERSSSQDYQGKRSSSQDYQGKRSSSQDYHGGRPIEKGEDPLAKTIKEKDRQVKTWPWSFFSSRHSSQDYQPSQHYQPTGPSSDGTRKPRLSPKRAHSQSYIEKPLPELPTHTTTLSQGRYQHYRDKPLPELPTDTTTLTLSQDYEDYKEKPLPELPTDTTTLSQDYQDYEDYKEKPLPELPTHTTTLSQGRYQHYREKPLPKLPTDTTTLTLSQDYEDYKKKPLPELPTDTTTLSQDYQDYQDYKEKPLPELSTDTTTLGQAYQDYEDYEEKPLPELPTHTTTLSQGRYQHYGERPLPELPTDTTTLSQAYQDYEEKPLPELPSHTTTLSQGRYQHYGERPLPELPTDTTTLSQAYQDYEEKPLPELPSHMTTLSQAFQDYREKPLPESPTDRNSKRRSSTHKLIKHRDPRQRLSTESPTSKSIISTQKPLPELPTHNKLIKRRDL